MSWRFRKTFKVLPGVKLNLTSRGLSATLGAAPFSVNVGPRGVYQNVSIPGTGFHDRSRVDLPSLVPAVKPLREQLPHSVPPIDSGQQHGTEIRSASTELLGSHSTQDLRKVLQETYDERAALDQEIAAAEYEARGAEQRYQKWERGFLYRRVFKQAFAARKVAHETAQAKRQELHEQLRLTTLATEIDIDREQAEPYYRMRDDFAALSECQKTWDTLERRAINRVVERSAASELIIREPVSFALNYCDLIHWEQKIPHLPNRMGGDLYIYPGFILYRASKQAFALIDSREVTLAFRSQRFIEEQTVPSDTKVISQAWAKSNKDGSPDRRFHDNYQIPIVLYGVLTFTSPSGLHEEYQCSNPDLAERFAKAWNSFQISFAAKGRPSEAARPEQKVERPVQTLAVAFAKESDNVRRLAASTDSFGNSC